MDKQAERPELTGDRLTIWTRNGMLDLFPLEGCDLRAAFTRDLFDGLWIIGRNSVGDLTRVRTSEIVVAKVSDGFIEALEPDDPPDPPEQPHSYL